jgi:hypothetical protein
MALTQMQIIQSLGDAMSWFERELSWGVPPTELRHLCGRIGELYAALITNGQLAPEVNQAGYDVVSASGERISVKTTAVMGLNGHINFNPNSLGEVDRVIILRINTEEMQVETLLNAPAEAVVALMGPETAGGRRMIPIRRLISSPTVKAPVRVAKEATYRGYTIRELESGTIDVTRDGRPITPTKPVLREIARKLNLSLLNSNGNPFNTRQLGTQVLKSLDETLDR